MDQSMGNLKDETQICDTLQAYIMCGGGGTRLWPLSRADNPKQNLHLSSARSMLDETLARVNGARLNDVMTTVNLMGGLGQVDSMTAALNRNLDAKGTVICEPFGRNTAPAVAISTLHSQQTPRPDDADENDPFVLILPSDHVINPVETFANAVASGLEAARKGQIVVFGIEPTHPATGYGYIEATDRSPVSPVARFREKPDQDTAQSYIETGKFLWNAGIFLFKASTMVKALEEHAPDILSACAETLNVSSNTDANTLKLDHEVFAKVRSESIDFAVMEQAKNVTVVRADFQWHDVGSFSSLHALRPVDEDNVSQHGDVISTECSNTFIHSDGPLVTAVGLENIAIISTPDATLVTPLNRTEDVRKIVSELEKSERPELKISPWLPERGVTPGAYCENARKWLFEDALPFWSLHGMDEANGGFHEVLDLEGQSTNADKRLRTMARQIFVYGKAKEMGWEGDADRLIQHGLQFLSDLPKAKLGGWYKTLSAESNPIEMVEDAYDHAFVLLALAQSRKAKVDFDLTLLNRVESVFDGLRDDNSNRPVSYLEDTKNTLPRRANPHMHLLEAFMAWYEASGDQSYLEKAGEIVSLFKTQLFDSGALLLCEEFDQKFDFSDGHVSRIEPGHHFEWAYLLQDYANLSGTKPLDEINGLFANASALGTNRVTQNIYDEVAFDGAPSHYSSRCWVQTEYASALNMMGASGKPHLLFEAERTIQRLFAHYIKPAPAGMWIDVVDGRGLPVSQTVPASTFYHLIGAVDVYLRAHQT